jgi:hypothetical protein
MASLRLRSAASAGPFVAALLVVLVSGCATAPAGGAPQPLEGQSGQQQAFVAPLPPPRPEANAAWKPSNVVKAFLAASANFELDPGAARQYLAPGVKLPWDNVTGQPPTVTVVNGPPSVQSSSQGYTAAHQRLTGGVPSESVTVTGERLASLSSRGDYLYEPGTETYKFVLGDYNGTWLIQQLPPSQPDQNLLLLTETAFEQVFQPRNLYFFGPQQGPSENYLVPDPVFVPLEVAGAADATSVATELVQGLLKVPEAQPTWLSSATYTAFPGGTALARPGVTISNLTARVSLQVPGTATTAELSQMYAQLNQTLTSSAYSSGAIVQHVQLVVNGKVVHVGTGSASVPAVGTNQDSYYAATQGAVDEWSSPETPTKVMFPGVLSPSSAITAVAVSPGRSPELAVAVQYLRGCEVFVGRADQAARLKVFDQTSTGGACTSLSWDNGSNLWIVAGSDIYVLEMDQGADLIQVDPPPTVHGQVLALRIAPDGVRAAFLVQTRSGNEMLLAAVTYPTGGATFGSVRPVGADLADPTAISWYRPDDLIALDGSELYEVPLTGFLSQPLTGVPGGTVAISAAGSNALAVRTNAGLLYISTTPGNGWGTPIMTAVEAGPDYPG